jgi:endonuclease/exonuclease/phosphatase family metal-dependent hydrolase
MKLVSVNIEDRKHLTRVLPFIEKELPDIICLQEVLAPDIKHFEALGYTGYFLPMTQLPLNDTYVECGIAICTRLPHTEPWSFYYHKIEGETPLFNKDTTENIRRTMNRCVLGLHIAVGEHTFNIATTHFTWTPNGLISPEQIADLEVLASHPLLEGPHILCGDFNVPREQNSLYQKLTALYSDNIPFSYISSLDRNLHRHGKDADKQILFDSFMVDYIFSQPPYIVSDVRLEFGLSDHAAVVGTVSVA